MLLLPTLKNKRWIHLLLLSLLYVSFYFWIGVIVVGDTAFYISGSVRVSPLYPLLLRTFRAVFSEEHVYTAVVIFQELLLAYAIFSLTAYLDVRFKTGVFWNMAATGLLVFLLYVMRPLFVGRRTEFFFCNAIMTEGITYPLYLLFFKYLFAAVDEHAPKRLIPAAVLSFLLTSTRGQLFFLPLVLLAALPAACKTRTGGAETPKKRIIFRALAVAGVYAALTFAFSIGYHYLSTGAPTSTTMGKEVLLTAAVYNSDSEDLAALPPDSEARAILGTALEQSEAAGYTYRFASGGLFARYRHYEDNYDLVRIKLLNAVSAYYGTSDETVMAGAMRRMSQSLPALLLRVRSQYLATAMRNLIAGLARAVSQMSRFGLLVAAGVYACCFVCVFGSFKFARERYHSARVFLLLALLAALLNALFCCFGVFALSRYSYYNFPLIYLGLMLFFRQVLLDVIAALRRRKA